MNNAELGTKLEEGRECPNCGGAMVYSAEAEGLLCPFCGYKEKIEAEGAESRQAEELDFASAENKENCEWGMEKVTVICESCGAESIYEASRMADVCPYCDSTHIIRQESKDTVKPGGVVPFQVQINDVPAIFKKWIKKRFFAPSAIKNSRPEKFNGVYLPYWTFDTDTQSAYAARYSKSRTRTNAKGETETVVDWYTTHGHYNEFIDDALVCATTKHEQHVLKKILPFDTADNKVFDMKYLAGYIAERYSIGLGDSWETAKVDIGRYLESRIASEVRSHYHADSASVTQRKTVFSNIKYKYLLLPLWISAYRFKDKVYNFMINGQTGKAGGTAPVSPAKVAILIAAIAAAIIAVSLVVRYA